MGFAERLKAYRNHISMTQGELASKMNVTQKTVSAWEVGRSEPTMGDVIKLCHILDCPIEDLTDTRSRNVGEISIEDIYAKLDALSIEELRNIRSITNNRIRKLEEEEAIRQEKAQLEKEVSEMQRRIEQYERMLRDRKQ